MRRPLLACVLAVAAVVGPASASAAPGDLDPSFSEDGIATVFGDGSVATAVAIAPDGRIVVAGYTLTEGTDVAVARFRPDGRFDPSFSEDGRVRIDAGGTALAFDVAVNGNGGIAVAGRLSTHGGDRMLAIRLAPDGELARSFAGDGVRLVGFDKPFQGASAVAFDGSDVVLAGYLSSGTTSRSAFARLHGDGSFDASFGGDGRIGLDLSAGAEQIDDVLVRDGGGLLGVGYAETGLAPRVAVVCLRPGGSPDPTFGGGDGARLYDLGRGADLGTGLVRVAGGDLVIAARAGAGWGFLRIQPRGHPDHAFGGDGIVRLPFPRHADEPGGIVRVPGGVAAAAWIGDDLGVVRLLGNGVRDDRFGRRGVVRLDPFGGGAAARSIAVQANGKLVVAGRASGGGHGIRMLVVRLRS
jgi:uncharacterized delta-60 repeat protein